MIKVTLLDRKIFWFILLILCSGMVCYIYAQHYLEIKKLLDASIESKNQLNNSSVDYSAIWGAFGDYVGGFLNPIIGLISVFLLFVTWRTTVETLNQTQTELKESRTIQKEIQKTQLLQQFDSFFFPFLAQLKSQENLLLVIHGESALKFIQNEEIYINKIILDFDSYQISVFGEHITITKNDNYVQSNFDQEYLATKEDTDEVIRIASSVDIIKKPL